MRTLKHLESLAALGLSAVLICGCDEVGPGHPYAYGPGGYGGGQLSSGAQPFSLAQTGSSSDAQAEYDRALADYNQALASYNNANVLGALNNANWAMHQNSAPGMGKLAAFGGMVAGNANQDDAARQVEIARQRLETARQKLAEQTLSVQTPAPSNGRIAIITEPVNAEIAVDGNPTGNAPCTLSLPSGIHDFQIAAPGYKGSSRRVAVIPDSEMTLKVILDN
jgi:hypothetical protein